MVQCEVVLSLNMGARSSSNFTAGSNYIATKLLRVLTCARLGRNRGKGKEKSRELEV